MSMGHWFNLFDASKADEPDAVRHQLTFYRNIVDNSGDCIYVREERAPGRFVYVNDAFCRHLGFSRDELLSMSVMDLDHDRTAQQIDSLKDEIDAASGQAVLTVNQRLKNDEIVPVEISVTRLTHQGAGFILGHVRDISHRLRLGQQDVLRSRFFELLVLGKRLDEIFKTLVEYVESLDDGLRCSIMVLDKASNCLKFVGVGHLPAAFRQAFDGIQAGSQSGACGLVMQQGERLVIEAIQSHPAFVNFRQVCLEAGFQSCWSEPLRGENRALLGVLTVYAQSQRLPTIDDLRTLETAAEMASAAILRHRYDEEQQLALSVYNASKEAILVTDKDNKIIQVNPAFCTITGYDADEAMGLDPQFLRSGRTPSSVFRDMWQQLDEQGHWQGEVVNLRKSGEEFSVLLTVSRITDSDGDAFRYVGIFADITEWKNAQDVIVRQANFDTLTGLPNRRLFRDRLEHEMRKTDRDRGLLVLMFLDLDHFKEVNDTMGHDAGDQLLVEAAKRMLACVRATDTVSRLGGDEFALILGSVPSAQLAERVAGEVLKTLSAPFTVKGENAHVSASIGITFYPDDAKDAESLMKNADQAMYAAKAQGRDRFSWFTETMQKEAEKRLMLANDLREALAKEELQVYYQPIIDLQSWRVVKAEALIRWTHPTLGPIPPTMFVPVAEETGQIGILGSWVFRQSALMVKKWVDWAEAHGDPELAKIIRVSVNKSPKQFHIQTTYATWVETLKEIGLHPSHMVIEITENLFLGDHVDIAAKLQRFRDVGMALSLDDFGTGYSSLGYLKKYEVDYLKMDQSFVRGMMEQASDRAIAEAILAMASRLGLDVVAEGIEYPEQRDFLTKAGCRYGQGFLFWKPMPEDEFLAVVCPS